MDSLKNIFKTNEATGVSTFRFYLLRFFYVVIMFLLGNDVWTEIFTHEGAWEPLPGVAYSFWAAFTALAILGIIHPLKMLPLLLMQFTYKLIWIIIVALPLWSANQLTGSPAEGLAGINTVGIIIDLIVIPWPYVLRNYVLTSKSR